MLIDIRYIEILNGLVGIAATHDVKFSFRIPSTVDLGAHGFLEKTKKFMSPVGFVLARFRVGTRLPDRSAKRLEMKEH